MHRGRGPEQFPSHPSGLVLENAIDGEPGGLLLQEGGEVVLVSQATEMASSQPQTRS